MPALESVTERLLREEEKLKVKEDTDESKKLLVVKKKKQLTCHYCKKPWPGHFKRDCPRVRSSEKTDSKHKKSSSTNAMLIDNALVAKSRDDWIIDSGASSHKCNDRSMFTTLRETTEKVTLGDGSTLAVTGQGTVCLDMLLADGTKKCLLRRVLYVPELAYNLVSVYRATEAGKTVHFDDDDCEFRDNRDEVIVLGVRDGSLYYLKFVRKSQNEANVAQVKNRERLWHRRFGHLNEQSMQKLVKEQLVNHLDYDTTGEVGVCEACIEGKQCKSSFKSSETVTSVPLELVHSDVCEKMGHKSIGGAKYFLILLDDKTHYTCVFPLKTKDQVFERFKEWQAEVENFN